MTTHLPSAPINTEPVDEQHAAQLAEAQDQIDRLTQENDELQDEITGLRRERDDLQNRVDALESAIMDARTVLEGA